MQDILAENHYDFTPYNYVMNNPMSYVDLFGLDTHRANNVTPDQWKNFDVNNDVMQLSEVEIRGHNSANAGLDVLGDVITTFEVGSKTKEEVFDFTVRNNFKSNNTRNGWAQLSKSQQVWRRKRT